MKKVFIVHGFEGKPNGGWRPWLMGKLAKQNIYTCALAMPKPNHPVLSAWVEEITRHIESNKKDHTYLIGHSLGVLAILHFLSQTKAKNIKGIVLVSGPIRNQKKALVTFSSRPFQFEKIKSKVKNIAVIHGNNDRTVPISQAKELSKKLNVKPIIIKNGGHLNSSAGWTKLPQCLKALNKMIK